MRTVEEILNPEEIAAVKVANHVKDDDFPNHVSNILWAVAAEVEDFTSSNYRAGHRAADWFHRVAEAMSGHTFHVKDKRSFTMDDVVTVVNKAIDEAFEEHVDYWKDAPADFVAWFPKAVVGPDGPTEHPWGDAEVAALRKWLAVRPYRVWTVYKAVQVAAHEALMDSLLDVALGNEDGFSVQNATRGAFDKAVKALSV